MDEDNNPDAQGQYYLSAFIVGIKKKKQEEPSHHSDSEAAAIVPPDKSQIEFDPPPQAVN